MNGAIAHEPRTNMLSDNVRPLYSELQGYLAQAPAKGEIFDASVWQQVNRCIDELNAATEKDFSSFKPHVRTRPGMGETIQLVGVDSYRTKLAGLIAHLHAAYFKNENPPFAQMPSTVINQHQSQNQAVTLQLAIEVKSIIDRNISNYTEGTKEYQFLDKVRSALSNIGGIADLIKLILTTAASLGISAAEVAKLLG